LDVIADGTLMPRFANVRVRVYSAMNVARTEITTAERATQSAINRRRAHHAIPRAHEK
jgi:hypothetical protein